MQSSTIGPRILGTWRRVQAGVKGGGGGGGQGGRGGGGGSYCCSTSADSLSTRDWRVACNWLPWEHISSAC